MTIKKLVIYVIVPILVVVTYYAWPSNEIIHPAGVIIEEEPLQTKTTDGKTWTVNEYNYRTLADFKIEARVLGKEGYSLDRESDISPYDLALGWGPMSDQAVIDQMEIWQRTRWYYWDLVSRVFPIPRRDIQKYSANMHIIPADKKIESELDNIVKGNIISIEGYLVAVTTSVDKWSWTSSLSREDTGGGACEVLWVEKIKIIK